MMRTLKKQAFEMKTLERTKNNSSEWSPYSMLMQCAAACTLVLLAHLAPAQTATPRFQPPSWWFGGAGGVNFNFYQGTTQQLNDELTTPEAFRHGDGMGLFLAPVIEYRNPDSRFGVSLMAGYDSRKGEFDQVTTPCDCPADLSTDLGYITVEPSLIFSPFKGNFYLYGGPRVAFGRTQAFDYQLGVNPNVPDQEPTPAVEGDFNSMERILLSMQVGMGYNIPLTDETKQTQAVLTPFVALHPYFGQSPRAVETWTLTTIRAGLALKFGRGKRIEETAKSAPVVVDPLVRFSVNSPKNIVVDRRVRETFPLRNYIFFDLGSTSIPDRYVLLTKDQIKDFKEDQLEVFTPKTLDGRSRREMVVYYNLINILGDRLGKNPKSSITLVGSSEKGPEDAKVLAEAVKTYLVDVFGIASSRIITEGQGKPATPSEQVGGTQELVQLREEDRRVTIKSTSPEMLMEFQSGPAGTLKPVVIVGVQEAPIDSYMTFYAKGSDKALDSWSLEVRDSKGKLQNFGPYIQEQVTIPGKTIMGSEPQGDYKMTMVGQTKSGKTVRQDTTVSMSLWKPQENELGMRYSIIYEFNESKAIAIYEKYLTEVVTPQIPSGATVAIHGYTDAIGDREGNEALSQARANDVKAILQSALGNRKDVKFKVFGFGEDQNLSPLDNKYPEQRFYNRTVVIDIIPVN